MSSPFAAAGSVGSAAPRRKRRWLLPVVIALVLVLLGGTTLVLAEVGILPFSLPFRLPFTLPFAKAPQGELLTRMLDAIPTIKSAEYSATIALVGEPKKLGSDPLDLNAFFKAQQEAVGSTGSLYEDSLYSFLPNDIKFDLTMHGKSEKEKEGKPTDVEIGLTGSYASGGTTFTGDVEVRKVGTTLYGIIRKFPNLFFFDTSGIQNKWVAITEEDLASTGYASDLFVYPLNLFDQEDESARKRNEEAVEQIKSTIRTAIEKKLIIVDRSLGTEQVEGQDTEHLAFKVDLQNASAFYEAIVVDLADRFGDAAFFHASDNTRKFLSSDAFKQFTDAVNKNAQVDLWVDPRTAYPVKFQFQLTVTPNAEGEKFKDVQFVFSLATAFKNINKSVTVDEPDDVIPFDEAERLISGISKEQQQFEKQRSRVEAVRSMLKQHQAKTGSYPASLEDLQKFADEEEKQCEAEKSTGDARQRARDAQRKSDLSQLRTALALYADDNRDSYPDSLATVVPGYLAKQLMDPTTQKEYQYATCNNHGSYVLSAQLEGYDQTTYYSLDSNGLSKTGAQLSCPATTSSPTSATKTYVTSCSSLKYYLGKFQTADLYTGKAYGYSREGDDYRLTYEIKFFEDDSHSITDEFVEGQNTATSKDISVEKVSRYENINASFNVNTNTSRNVNATVTAMLSPDTDSDGITDETELERGSDPAKPDTDADGLPDYDELYKYRTNVARADTDGDGYSDMDEVTNGYNPTGPGLTTATQKATWSKIPSFLNGPEISNIAVAKGSGQVTVSWTTNIAADSVVNYGETTGYGSFKNNTSFSVQHAITLTTISGKTYHYAIRTCTVSPDSRCTNSADQVFTAP